MVFAARGVFAVEDRERLIERGVSGVRFGRHMGGGRGRVDAQSVLCVPLVAPTKGLVRIAERQREVRYAVVIEDRIGRLLVVDQRAVDADPVAWQRDGDAALRRLAGFGNVSALRAAGIDIERLGRAVPVGFHAHEAAEVIGHGKVGDVAVGQQGILGVFVVDDLPVERHLGSDDVGAHCGLGLRQQTERERDAAGDGKQDAQKSFVDGRHNILLSVL